MNREEEIRELFARIAEYDYKDLDALLFPYIVKRRWFDKKNKCWWQECIKITYDKEKYYLYVPDV